MSQLSLNPAATPATLCIDVHQDPFDPDAVLSVRAIVYNAHRQPLAAHRITLPGLEADFLDTVAQVIVQSFQFGSPATDLRSAMGRVKRQATKHRKAHQRD